MIKKPDILVLEDDEYWRLKICDILRTHGFNPLPYEDGKKAVECIRKDTSNDIRGAIIDKLLLVKGEGGIPRTQNYQGKDVIKIIKNEHSDIAIVMVTDAPVRESEGSSEQVSSVLYTLEEEIGVPVIDKSGLKSKPQKLIKVLNGNIKDKPVVSRVAYLIFNFDCKKIYCCKDKNTDIFNRLREILKKYVNEIDYIKYNQGVDYSECGSMYNMSLDRFIMEHKIFELDKIRENEQGFKLLLEISKKQADSNGYIFLSEEDIKCIFYENQKLLPKNNRQIASNISRTMSKIRKQPRKNGLYGKYIDNSGNSGYRFRVNILNPKHSVEEDVKELILQQKYEENKQADEDES